MKRIPSLFLMLPISLMLNACATNMGRQFERVQVGMEKDQVLALMDSPQRTQRWKGLDRWTYIFYVDGVRQEKEVQFRQGTATYAGPPPKPEITAQEIDQKNEKENTELEAALKQQIDTNKRSFQIYEDNVSGTDQIRYVPEFKPVE
jgi:outer membrane protein assembly factor BamE